MNTLAEIDIADLGVHALNDYFPKEHANIYATPDEQSGDVRRGFIHWGKHRFPMVSCPDISGRQLINVAGKGNHAPETVFVVSYVSPEMRVLCREAGINFLDSAGNCRIVAEDVNWVIDSHTAQPSRPLSWGRGFKYNGLKLIYACYEEPALLSGSYRVMAEKTGLSLGTISGIIEDLRKEGFWETRDDNTHAFNHGRELFQRWAYAYLDEVRPLHFRMELQAREGFDLAELETLLPQDGVLLGGERAAMARSGYLRSPNFFIHSNIRLGELTRKLRLAPFNRRAENRQVVELYSLFYASSGGYGGERKLDIPIVGDLIILAELLATHQSRQLEAADELLANEIYNRFAEFGFQW